MLLQSMVGCQSVPPATLNSTSPNGARGSSAPPCPAPLPIPAPAGRNRSDGDPAPASAVKRGLGTRVSSALMLAKRRSGDKWITACN